MYESPKAFNVIDRVESSAEEELVRPITEKGHNFTMDRRCRSRLSLSGSKQNSEMGLVNRA